MEGGRPISEQALSPAEETELTHELPETRSNRLGHLYNLFRNRTNESEKPPEEAPPLLLEQLVEAAAGAQPEGAIEVEVESIQEDETEVEAAARERLEKAYEATAEVTPEEEEELPEEAQYERRAETSLGGDATDDHEQQNLAAAITKVLTDIKQKTAIAHASFNRWKPQKPTYKPPLPAVITNLPSLYQQAVLAGFVAAFVILLAIAVI